MINSKIKYILLFILFTITSENIFSQFNEYYPEVDWFTIETEHFAVHYHAGTERTAKVIAKIAEEIYEPLTSLYNYKPDKVHFVIKDIDDFANGATYFFDNKIEIWASALDTELRGTTHWLRNVISHEYTHMIQLQASMKTSRKVPAFYLQWLNYEQERRPDVLYGYPNGILSYPVPFLNIPSWFAEGTAQYMRKEFSYDFWDTHRDMLLRSYALDNNMLTWNQMQVFGKTSLGNESVYNSGFGLVNYIAEKYGENKLKEIVDNSRSLLNFTIDGAIKNSLGKSGKELYEEWKSFLVNDYSNRVEKIRQKLYTGNSVSPDGFANLFPVISSNGNKIYYISNKGMDYFITSVYEYDMETGKNKLVQPGVFSVIDITKDGKTLIYSKITDENKNWAKTHDIYKYDLSAEEETRLTFGLRANNPTLSPDNSKIVFISQKDGTTNIYTMNFDGTDIKKITEFRNGEQVFTARFSPNGDYIIFDHSLNDSRDVSIIKTDGSGIQPVFNSKDDERSPLFINNNEVVFSADFTGIYNIYKYNLSTKELKQITNVIGGAFYPYERNGNLTYSGYTSSGFKIYNIDKYLAQDFSGNSYINRLNREFISSNRSPETQFDWNKLKNFDDSIYPDFSVDPYKGRFTSLTILPFLRLDNYSKTAKGIEQLKPGVYFFSSDMLNRFSIMGGASINLKWERDLFLSLEYRDRIPLLYQLGLKPEIVLEGYNVSRTTKQNLGFQPDTLQTGEIKYFYETPVDVSYNLIEFNFKAKHKIFSDDHLLTFSFVFSRYESIIESFLLPDNQLYPTTRDVYLIGRQFGIKYNYEQTQRKIDDDINPLGTKISLKFDYEFDKFNPQSDYEVKDGMLVPLYQNIDFCRFEANLSQNYELPFSNHSLGYRLKLGSIIGPQVDDFFDFYLGGLIGMKGYPFYAISGNELAYLNLNYRFPVFREIDFRLGPLYLDKIFASVYADFGNAWNDKEFQWKDIKKGVGAELRVQMNSFYIFPTSFFINISYAFDPYTRITTVTKEKVNYGKEFRYYFGVLFDFDFIQDTFKF